MVSLSVPPQAQPKVCVLSLTRDRLEYTKHCFATLREYAGCDFDHYVLDNGSTDGTLNWLVIEYGSGRTEAIEYQSDNVGISRGMNKLLEMAGPEYDWYVKFDNDCELTTPNTLKDALQDPNWILSPHIQGLDHPPAIDEELDINGVRVGETSILGGIFMAVPSWVFEEYRHAEDNPIWGMDDVRIVEWFKGRGGRVGYMLDYPANHIETTQGQRRRYPSYFLRKDNEFYHGR